MTEQIPVDLPQPTDPQHMREYFLINQAIAKEAGGDPIAFELKGEMLFLLIDEAVGRIPHEEAAVAYQGLEDLLRYHNAEKALDKSQK